MKDIIKEMLGKIIDRKWQNENSKLALIGGI
jgi:hypothetical protein